MHTFNPVTEAKADDFWVLGQPGLHSAFQDSQGCVFETLSGKKGGAVMKFTAPYLGPLDYEERYVVCSVFE